ncbi:MAG: UbiD family decarboxylase [Nitrososphaerota archaeon]
MRDFLNELEKEGELINIVRPVSTKFEAAAIMKKLDGKPVLFHKLKECEGFKLVANVCGNRRILAKALGVSENAILRKLNDAIENPSKGEIVEDAPCQQVVDRKPDLRKLPFLIFGEHDGGPYATASIIIAYDREYGFNASFHRLMLIDRNKVVARILPRHLDEFIRRGNRNVAITFGNHPAFMIAAAVSWKIGISELDIANSLRKMRYARCVTNELLVPADCEGVMEGVVTDELADEGPIFDITGTYDVVRKQRVIEIECVTMRRDPIFQAILLAGSEHKTLMGTPREATIYKEVGKVCECLDVRLTPGGCKWLHAVVKIKKRHDDDGRKAIEAAFRGHGSLKHVIVVDEDINIDDPVELEWALATRVQLDKRLVLKPNEYGSSLDPSADQYTRKTCKAGIDATLPLGADLKLFKKATIPGEESIKIEDYIK